jgi:hypothetical protein
MFFSSFIIKIPKSSNRWSIEREREYLKKEEGKRKAPRVSANKMAKSIF